MRKHRNPYDIYDPDDFFEVGENSSHPELNDYRRRWFFGAYSFSSATELQKFFDSEGLSTRNYVMHPIFNRDAAANTIDIHIIPKHQKHDKKEAKEFRFKG